MKNFSKAVLTLIAGMFLALCSTNQAMAATNDAVDGGTTSLTLNPSGLVTVNAATITLIKQVYDTGGTCLANDANAAGIDLCPAPATSITVPSGTGLQFLIYVRNTSSVTLTDVRFADIIDDSLGAAGGFAYAGPNAITTTPIAGLPTAAETAANIYTAASGGFAQTDAVDIGVNNYVSIQDAGGQAGVVENVTVGAVATQTNATLDIPANSTFAVLIPVTKN